MDWGSVLIDGLLARYRSHRPPGKQVNGIGDKTDGPIGKQHVNAAGVITSRRYVVGATVVVKTRSRILPVANANLPIDTGVGSVNGHVLRAPNVIVQDIPAKIEIAVNKRVLGTRITHQETRVFTKRHVLYLERPEIAHDHALGFSEEARYLVKQSALYARVLVFCFLANPGKVKFVDLYTVQAA